MKTILLSVIAGFAAGFIACGVMSMKAIDRLKGEHAAEITSSLQSARETERKMVEERDELKKKYEEKIQQAEISNRQLRNDLRAGKLRLSVAVKKCTVPAASGTGSGEARVELDPTVADDLVSIATDGDIAIRKLNYCIDQYNAVRAEFR